jgi:formate hydrogenlyase subunit 6/NADH:ubiquinone oxidoreductase subunit I
MKLGSMFRDVIQSLFRKPVTQLYPFERTPVPARLHGKVVWDADKCTGCGLCTKDCPADAIELVVNDKKAKAFVMRYNVDRCIFCAQCAQNCRLGSISLSNQEWELAVLNRDTFTEYWGKPENVEAYLAQKNAPPEAEAVAPLETSDCEAAV